MHQTHPQIRTEYKIPTHSSRKTTQIHIVHFVQFYIRRRHAAGKQLVFFILDDYGAVQQNNYFRCVEHSAVSILSIRLLAHNMLYVGLEFLCDE